MIVSIINTFQVTLYYIYTYMKKKNLIILKRYLIYVRELFNELKSVSLS